MQEWDPYKALYIHIPFCKQRCKYCDFPTNAVSFDSLEIDSYLEHLIAQIRTYSNNDLLGSIQTVYIGGGTPTYLGNKRLSSLLYALSISMHLTTDVECTLEANPDSLTSSMVKDCYALGVNRISIGVQSFNDYLLNQLGRIHSSEQAKQAITNAKERFENISIDLMCGLPGQTLPQFKEDLLTALSLGVSHISIYPLTIEEGTPFYSLEQQGKLILDEDLEAECMEFAESFLSSKGMHRYEVASYAYPGYKSRHNSAYWNSIPYLGIGTGAVSMRQNDLYRQRFSETDGIIEELDIFQMAAEDLMLRMRMSEGVSDEEISIAAILLPETNKALNALEQDGFVCHQNNRWKPTHKGWLFGNQLYGRLLELAP